MSPRTALSFLTLCATVMCVGLGLAMAQEPPVTPRIPPIVGTGARPAPITAGRRPRQAQAQAESEQSPPGAPGTPGTPGAPGEAAPELPPFETGIDFQPAPPGSRVTFNLEDADLPDLVRLISSITGRRFILPSKARSIKATVYAPTRVTVAEAYEAFLSILNMNGLSLVQAGRYLKVVESPNIESQPIPTYTGAGPTPTGDRYITRLHTLQNVTADDVAQLLGRFKSPEGNITAYAPTNTVIITDTGTNIRRMMQILEAIDVPRTGEQIWIEPIHHANATELATRLEEIFAAGASQGASGGEAGRAGGRPTPPRSPTASVSAQPSGGPATVGSRGEARLTKIIPDERTNSLVILATERAYVRILELIRQLDVPLEGGGGVHVYRVQHGDAEDLANTINGLVGATGGRAAAPRAGAAGAQGAGAAPAVDMFEGQVRVTAHTATNALLITASMHDYAALRGVIERLDAPRRQVFIEAVIMELAVNRSSRLGISFHGGIPNIPADGSLAVLGSNAQSSMSPISAEALTGLALGVRGPTIEEGQQFGLSIPAFGVVINALAQSGDTNILSTPHIIAMDNVEAEISVGENVPLQTSGIGGLGALGGLAGGQGGAGAGGMAGLAGLAGMAGGFGMVPRQDVGTTIRITPHVNDTEEIRLEISEEISEAVAQVEGSLGVRSISKRNAKTELVVRDAQTVVIGGLMRDTVTVSETKIPILGDIPLLGLLFRQTTRSTRKTNLLLFLTPYIIRDAADLRAIYERKMRERQEFIDRYFVFGQQEYEPPTDYSRTRGLVAEIVAELRSMDSEERLAAELEAQPLPTHEPRPPVGALERGEGGEGSAMGPGGEEGDIIIEPNMPGQSMEVFQPEIPRFVE